jgi:hypothetical protein
MRAAYAVVISNDFDAPGLRGAKPASRLEMTVRIRGYPTLRRTILLRSQGRAAVSNMHRGTL